MIIKTSSSNYETFELCPEGTHQAVLAEIVDMGMIEVEYQGTKSMQHKILLVYQVLPTNTAGQEIIRQDGSRVEVSVRFTASLHEKSNLFKWLQNWSGRKFSEPEKAEFVTKGFDLDKLLGVNGLLQVIHASSVDGIKTYANAQSILPWQQKWGPKIVVAGYVPRGQRKSAAAGAAPDKQQVQAAIKAQAPFDSNEDDIPF